MTDPVSSQRNILDRFKLDGRVAMVTGGGSGIGRGFAHALGEAGARVALVDRDLPAAEAVAQELAAKRIEVVALQADVTRSEEVDRTVEKVVQHFGRLTIGVNNAGIGAWVDSEAQTDEQWRKVLALNLDAVYWCARAQAKFMLPAGYGKIVNTASMSGHIVNFPQNQSAYNASKAAVIHLTRSLATEWAARGVRVNSISPGYTRTKMVDVLLATPIGQTMQPVWMERTPMNRMAEVDDLQGAVVYLSSAASDFTTGTDLVIDGGYLCW